MAPSIAYSSTTKESIRHGGQFGNLVGLRPISVTTTTTPNNNKTTKTRTKIINKQTKVVKITEHTWEKLRGFSHHYHEQPITYDEIIEELVDFYNNNKHN